MVISLAVHQFKKRRYANIKIINELKLNSLFLALSLVIQAT